MTPTKENSDTLPQSALLEDTEVTPEERARVLRDIEQVVAERRAPVTPEAFTVKPRKLGVLLPVAVNAAAVVLVAAGILGLSYTFRLRQETLTLKRGAYQSAEGTLLDAFQRQSQREISEVQERLQAAESSLQNRLQAREAELRRTLAAELAAERERLKDRGTASAEIESRLRELEKERQAVLEMEVERYRRELELRQLAAEREQEKLFGDQIAGSYGLFVRNLQASEYPAALKNLDSLKGLLNDPALENLPAWKVRRSVELALIEALAELVALRSRSAQISQEPESATAAERSRTAEANAELERQLKEAERARQEAERKLAATQIQLAARERQLQELQKAERSRAAETDAVQARSSRTVDELRQKNDRLSAQLSAANSKADVLAEQTRTAEEKAARQGREEALKEIMGFLDYLAGDSTQKKELQSQLLAVARQDPLFSAVIREIQVLAAASGLSGRSATMPFKLLGTVSSVSAGKAVVEPLVDLAVTAGTRVQIRRASDLDSEITIGQGTIQQASGGKITIMLDAKGAQPPAIMDTVYVEVKAGE